MAKFYVGVSTTLCTTLCIEAGSEDEAVDLAQSLAFDDAYVGNAILDGFATDEEAYRTKSWTFESCGIASDGEDVVNDF